MNSHDSSRHTRNNFRKIRYKIKWILIFASWQIVFSITCWSRQVLQSSCLLACQVPCSSISRPWEAFPDLRGERATSAHEPQKCPRNQVDFAGWTLEPSLRQLSWGPTDWLAVAAAAGGHATQCAVAGLVWVSDISLRGKNLPWHGLYGAYKTIKPCRILPRMHVIACNEFNYM